MVLAVEARKLSIPLNSPSPTSVSSPFPPRPISIIFDSNSQSLALMLADSSISLFSSFSAFSVSSSASLHPPQTLIPAPSLSACFIHLNSKPNSDSLTLFVAAGPSNDGSRVLLRFIVRSKEAAGFLPGRVACGQKGVEFDRKSGGVLVDFSHGSEVVLAGSVNYFAMYSASAAKVCLFGVKSVVDDRGDIDFGGVRVHLRLVKCAVIDCQVPVTCISVSSGFLIMGELNGVRVIPLRPLVKGSVGRKKNTKKPPLRLGSKENENLEGTVEIKLRNSKLPNGLVGGQEGRYDVNKNVLNQVKFKIVSHNNALGMPGLVPNGIMGAQINGNPASSGKPKSQRLSQDSNNWGAIFVPFSSKDEGLVVRKSPYLTKKATSIHVFLQNKFLVADSDGNVHILCASLSGSSVMRQLTDIIEVRQIAVYPDSSESLQTVWLSDGDHSVHVMAPSSDTSTYCNVNKIDSEDIQLSVIETIFVGENIRDVQSLSANAVLILGQVAFFAIGSLCFSWVHKPHLKSRVTLVNLIQCLDPLENNELLQMSYR